MSVRHALGAVRRFASSSRTLAAAGAEGSSAPGPINSGFAAIRDIFDIPSSSSSSSLSSASSSSSSSSSASLAPSTISQTTGANGIGYDPHSLPPSVDPTLDMLTNCLMKDGKKSEAQKMVSRILEMIQTTTNLAPQPLVRQAILLSSPSIKMLSMRKSAKTVLTPRGLTERQRSRQGVAWLLKAAERGRKGGVSRDARIAREVLAVLEGQSEVFKWLEERHKVAYLNRSNMTAR